jgi:hypothetical protein
MPVRYASRADSDSRNEMDLSHVRERALRVIQIPCGLNGAELVLIDGLGHNLPPGLWERFADHIAQVVQRGEATRAARGAYRAKLSRQ